MFWFLKGPEEGILRKTPIPNTLKEPVYTPYFVS